MKTTIFNPRQMGAIPFDGATSFRVWAPNASSVAVVGEFNNWNPESDVLEREENGLWCREVKGAIPLAHQLADQSLEVQMKYFNPNDNRMVVMIKTNHGVKDPPPFPMLGPGKPVPFPPPKGAIKVGTLLVDLDHSPWYPGPSNLDIDFRDEATVVVYHIHSDNPAWPELRVVGTKGRVTQVTGGAENEPDTVETSSQASDAGNPASAPPVTPAATDSSWVGWLFDLFFKK